MEIVRKIIDSHKLIKIVDLPIEMKNVKVEITIRPIEVLSKNDLFDPNEYRGILKIDNISQEIEKVRMEWDRS